MMISCFSLVTFAQLSPSKVVVMRLAKEINKLIGVGDSLDNWTQVMIQ